MAGSQLCAVTCAQVSEFWSLGLEPIAVSAISGTGTGDLMEQLVASLPPPKRRDDDSAPGEAPPKPLAVAIVGRPNVGKSSLLNSLVRARRSAPNRVGRRPHADVILRVTIAGPDTPSAPSRAEGTYCKLWWDDEQPWCAACGSQCF